MINESAILKTTMNALQDYSGHFYILDEMDRPIFTFTEGESKRDSGTLMQHIADDPNQISVMKIDDVSYSVVSLRSEVNAWRYMTVMPTHQFMGKVGETRTILNVTIALVMLLGLLISFLLAKKQYTPLRSIVHTIQQHGEGSGSKPGLDEFAIISNTIEHHRVEKDSLMTKLKSSSGILKEHLLYSLLRGKVSRLKEIQRMLDRKEIRFPHSYYVILLFIVDDYEHFQQNYNLSMQDLFRFSIMNVAEELAHETGARYGVDMMDHREIALILNIDHTDKEPIGRLAYKAQEFFNQYYKFTLTVSVGRPYPELLMLHNSYMEASRAAYYRFILGNNRTIFYEDIEAQQNNTYIYPKELEDLVLVMKQGKAEEAASLIQGMVRMIIQQAVSPDAAIGFYFGIINALLKAMSEIEIEISDSLEKKIEKLFTEKPETMSSLQERLLQFCGELCEVIHDQKESKNVQLSDDIMKYVKNHHTEQSLSLEFIAAHFNMSSSYITRFFKNQTGYTLMRYVDLLRMTQAKELLKQTNWTIKQIVEQVGYVDETNFIRKFKKVEGVTPVAYRKRVQEH